MEKLLLYAILITGLIGGSCSGKKQPGEMLVEANKVHLEAVAIYDEAHTLLDAAKGKAVARNDSALLVRVDSVHQLLHAWKESLYEVPGFEHNHEAGGHNHEHEHKAVPAMTDESMLSYQKNAKTAVEEIKIELLAMSKE